MRSLVGLLTLLVLLVIILVYCAVLFWWYRQKKGLFAPYSPPPPPAAQRPFYPTGDIIPLTEEQIEDRDELIAESREEVKV